MLLFSSSPAWLSRRALQSSEHPPCEAAAAGGQRRAWLRRRGAVAADAPPPELGPERAGAPAGQAAGSGEGGSRWQDLKEKEDPDVWLKAEGARLHGHTARSSQPTCPGSRHRRGAVGAGRLDWALFRGPRAGRKPVQALQRADGEAAEPCWVAGGWACRELRQILQVRPPEAAVTTTTTPLCPPPDACPAQSFPFLGA